MDLDDEELEATRRLNGVAIESNNIQIIEDFIDEIWSFELNKDTIEIVNALEDFLEEREADRKRIKELEEENKKLLENSLDVINDMIPKQKVKDKMEKLNKEIKNADTIEAIFKIKQQQILEELLEDK